MGKPNGELSCIVIIYEDLDEPDFSDKTLSDGVIVFRNTTTITEKSFHKRYPTVIKKWIDRCPNHLMMITTHHRFAFDLIKKANFRPDMFYLYDSKRGYRHLPDTTPRELASVKTTAECISREPLTAELVHSKTILTEKPYDKPNL